MRGFTGLNSGIALLILVFGVYSERIASGYMFNSPGSTKGGRVADTPYLGSSNENKLLQAGPSQRGSIYSPSASNSQTTYSGSYQPLQGRPSLVTRTQTGQSGYKPYFLSQPAHAGKEPMKSSYQSDYNRYSGSVKGGSGSSSGSFSPAPQSEATPAQRGSALPSAAIGGSHSKYTTSFQPSVGKYKQDSPSKPSQTGLSSQSGYSPYQVNHNQVTETKPSGPIYKPVSFSKPAQTSYQPIASQSIVKSPSEPGQSSSQSLSQYSSGRVDQLRNGYKPGSYGQYANNRIQGSSLPSQSNVKPAQSHHSNPVQNYQQTLSSSKPVIVRKPTPYSKLPAQPVQEVGKLLPQSHSVPSTSSFQSSSQASWSPQTTYNPKQGNYQPSQNQWKPQAASRPASTVKSPSEPGQSSSQSLSQYRSGRVDQLRNGYKPGSYGQYANNRIQGSSLPSQSSIKPAQSHRSNPVQTYQQTPSSSKPVIVRKPTPYSQLPAQPVQEVGKPLPQSHSVPSTSSFQSSSQASWSPQTTYNPKQGNYQPFQTQWKPQTASSPVSTQKPASPAKPVQSRWPALNKPPQTMFSQVQNWYQPSTLVSSGGSFAKPEQKHQTSQSQGTYQPFLSRFSGGSVAPNAEGVHKGNSANPVQRGREPSSTVSSVNVYSRPVQNLQRLKPAQSNFQSFHSHFPGRGAAQPTASARKPVPQSWHQPSPQASSNPNYSKPGQSQETSKPVQVNYQFQTGSVFKHTPNTQELQSPAKSVQGWRQQSPISHSAQSPRYTHVQNNYNQFTNGFTGKTVAQPASSYKPSVPVNYDQTRFSPNQSNRPTTTQSAVQPARSNFATAPGSFQPVQSWPKPEVTAQSRKLQAPSYPHNPVQSSWKPGSG